MIDGSVCNDCERTGTIEASVPSLRHTVPHAFATLHGHGKAALDD